MTLVVDAHAPIAGCRAAIRASDPAAVPGQTPMRIRSFASQIEDSLFSERLMMLLTSIFGDAGAGTGGRRSLRIDVVTSSRRAPARSAFASRSARGRRASCGWCSAARCAWS